MCRMRLRAINSARLYILDLEGALPDNPRLL